MKFKRLSEQELNNRKVLIRADLNVPQDDSGAIADDTRIKASMPAVEHSLANGAAVMVTSHLGRPTEGELTAKDSLAPIAERMSQLLGKPVRLQTDWVDGGFEISPGEVVLLENCRGNVGEKKNDEGLSRKMAALCDVYVNDAFGTSHRAQASTHGIAKFAPVACAGPLLAAELDALGKALHEPARPLVAIVGGSKVSTKLTILKSLAARVDRLIVGGGIANTFMLANGLPIGKSLAEPDLVDEAREIMSMMAERGAQVPIPVDVVCATEFSATATAVTRESADVQDDEMIFDVGPRTTGELSDILKDAGTIVWNGPVGVFEFDAFAGGTAALSEAIATSTGFSIAGGGDTLAAISKFNISDRVGYISTGGGAFLEFLEGKELPAVVALEERAL